VAAAAILSEIGASPARYFTDGAHLASWARLCPGNHDRGLDRGCICQAAETPEPARPAGAPMYGRGRFSGR
jgi:hypothetical protein